MDETEKNKQNFNEPTTDPVMSKGTGAPAKPKGRPKGARNVPKRGNPVPKPRKTPNEMRDTKSAIDRRLKEARELAARHDAMNGTGLSGQIPTPESIKNGPPSLPPQWIPGPVLIAPITVLFGMLGEMLDVENRPSHDAVAGLADSIAELTRHLPPASPLAVAAGAVMVAGTAAALPMLMEYKAIRNGELLPASKRKEDRTFKAVKSDEQNL